MVYEWKLSHLKCISSLLVDDGKIFHGSGVGDQFGPRCFEGDIMGCGIMFPRDYVLDCEGENTHVVLIKGDEKFSILLILLPIHA